MIMIKCYLLFKHHEIKIVVQNEDEIEPLRVPETQQFATDEVIADDAAKKNVHWSENESEQQPHDQKGEEQHHRHHHHHHHHHRNHQHHQQNRQRQKSDEEKSVTKNSLSAKQSAAQHENVDLEADVDADADANIINDIDNNEGERFYSRHHHRYKASPTSNRRSFNLLLCFRVRSSGDAGAPGDEAGERRNPSETNSEQLVNHQLNHNIDQKVRHA